MAELLSDVLELVGCDFCFFCAGVVKFALFSATGSAGNCFSLSEYTICNGLRGERREFGERFSLLVDLMQSSSEYCDSTLWAYDSVAESKRIESVRPGVVSGICKDAGIVPFSNSGMMLVSIILRRAFTFAVEVINA